MNFCMIKTFRLNALKKKRAGLYESYAEGILNEEEYAFAKQTYEEQYEALNRLLDEAVERRERFLESISPDNKWLTMMRGVAGMTGLTQEVVDAIIEKVLVYGGGRIEVVFNYTVNDQYDSEDSENSGNHLIVPLKNMINEAYAADISRKVKAQQRQAMRDGQFVGAQPPYGYKKDPDDCHHLLVNAETAPAIRQIFQWTADGVPLGAVVKRLNEQGTPSPGRYLAQIGLLNKQSQKAQGMWQTWTVAKILDSEVYTGDMVQGRSKMIGHKQVPTPPEEWIIVRNTHEPLVSRELFEKAKSVRKQAAAKTAGQVSRGIYTENILRGRIFCGACGRHMNRHRDNKLGVYSFSCIANQRIKKDACPRTAYIREDALFHIVLTIIRQEAENVVGKNLQLKQHSGKIAMQREATEKEISQLRQETEKNRKFLTGLLESFNTGILTRAEYLEMKESYSQEINAALQRVQQLQTRQKELESQMERYCCLADRLAAVEHDTALSSLLVNQLIERVTANGPSDVSIKFRFESGFEQLMEVLKDE